MSFYVEKISKNTIRHAPNYVCAINKTHVILERLHVYLYDVTDPLKGGEYIRCQKDQTRFERLRSKPLTPGIATVCILAHRPSICNYSCLSVLLFLSSIETTASQAMLRNRIAVFESTAHTRASGWILLFHGLN